MAEVGNNRKLRTNCPTPASIFINYTCTWYTSQYADYTPLTWLSQSDLIDSGFNPLKSPSRYYTHVALHPPLSLSLSLSLSMLLHSLSMLLFLHRTQLISISGDMRDISCMVASLA